MKNEDRKIIEVEKDPVTNLLGSLSRVEAPGDFDFRVKARIAQGRPAERKASLLPGWVGYAVPLTVLLVVGGYFGVRSLDTANTPASQPVAAIVPASNVEPALQASTQAVEPSANTILTAQRDEKLPESITRPKATLPERFIASTGSSRKNPGGGSYDATRRISPTITVRKPKDVIVLRRMPAKEMLLEIGVDAAYSNSSWKIGEVKPNSKAERSGLKSGDVVEAVNNQNLTEKSLFGSPFSSKSVRVLRDGKSMQIDLKP